MKGELLGPRLFEVEFFLGLLVVASIVATGVFSTALARMGERQRSLAYRESLTGCFNRRAFHELFQREAERSRRLEQGLSLVFLDVDHFKASTTRAATRPETGCSSSSPCAVQSVIRETDLLFRWGGEEFVILLPTPRPRMPGLAERVRVAVAERPFWESISNPRCR